MSVKRQATSDLNHDNWDQDDPNEHEEMGIFRSASQDVLQKRVIRTAKRRSQISGDDAKKGVFSGFGGFNKTQPSSFDFLSNLTNGNKSNGFPQDPKSDSTPSSSLFDGNAADKSSGGIFNMPTSTPHATNSTTLFGLSTANNTAAGPSLFSSTKADSNLESPFKIKPQSNETNASNSPGSKAIEPKVSSPQISGGLFGTATANAKSKSPFTTTTLSTSNVQPSSIKDTQANFGTLKKTISSAEKKPEENDSKLRYYSKLKGLNISVSDWIKKHVEETPLCILTPIFRDYEKHLKEIQEEYHGAPSNEKSRKEPEPTTKSSPFAANSLGASAFGKSDAPKQSSSVFSLENKPSAQDDKSSFSFGIKPVTNNSVATTSSGFSFGISSSPATSTTSSPFSLGTTTTTTANGTAPFSFGVGKPFSFNSNVQTTSEASKDEKEDEDEPPKVEFTPVVEENSVYDKRCKIFIKKDGNFVDKGIGTLYVKKIEESGKYQLLVRANTNLGTVLLNLILASAIPTQRMGKNNVMMVCIPTPDAKPPPTPILIRVKTSEEADALLETLDKFKA